MPALPRSLLLPLSVLGAALLLTACEPQARASLSPDFGNATRHNMALHTINPTPATADALPEHSGQRTTTATTRYHRDMVREAAPVDTSN